MERLNHMYTLDHVVILPSALWGNKTYRPRHFKRS